MDMTARIKHMTAGDNRKARSTPELTMAASGLRALLEFAASMGASRQRLAERSGIDPADLEDGDNRIPFSTYVALMRAGQELCDDPALSLHFGEQVDMSDTSVGCTIGGFQTIDEAFAQVNRYGRLAFEVEGVGIGDRFHLRRTAGELWIIDTRGNPNDFPELTETAFARMICSDAPRPRRHADVQSAACHSRRAVVSRRV